MARALQPSRTMIGAAELAWGALLATAAPDPLLDALIEQSVAVRPELRAAEATLRAEKERIPRAGALPDPSFTLGFQNDGFRRIQLGESDDTFFSVMGSQVFPWIPKLDLRSEIASVEAKQQALRIERVRLTIEAEVRRAYLELVLARDRLRLLEKLDALWLKSEGIARARYEAGEAPQSDLLRSQLERNRLRRRRWALETEARTGVQALNRLRSRPLEEPIETTASLRTIGPPSLPEIEAATTDAEARSPELRIAELAAQRAEHAIDLAEWERVPDFGVNLGVMPRAGEFEPMWQVGVSFTLPIYAFSKQNRAIAENEARREASTLDQRAVSELLRLRVKQRETALSYLLETIRLYRDALLIQSDATAESTLAQYQVGRVTFASVLEALAGFVADEEDYLAALADAQRVAISALEVSLDPPGLSAPGMGGRPIPARSEDAAEAPAMGGM